MDLKNYVYIDLENNLLSLPWPALFMVKSWNNARCMSFYILMNLWYGRIASWDIRVLVVFAPNLALCHWHAALFPY